MCNIQNVEAKMQLTKFIEKQEKTLIQASKELGFNYEDLRRYCAGLVIPRPDRMAKITDWSDGEVTANDFYERGE